MFQYDGNPRKNPSSVLALTCENPYALGKQREQQEPREAAGQQSGAPDQQQRQRRVGVEVDQVVERAAIESGQHLLHARLARQPAVGGVDRRRDHHQEERPAKRRGRRRARSARPCRRRRRAPAPCRDARARRGRLRHHARSGRLRSATTLRSGCGASQPRSRARDERQQHEPGRGRERPERHGLGIGE